MDERRVADYFVVAGLPDAPQPLEEFSNEAAIKPTYKQDPITDISVINKSIGEKVPRGYVVLDKTPTDYQADLNHGTFRCPEMYICFRRSRDKPPLTDVGVLYEGKERLMGGCEVVHTTYFGSPANINNSSSSGGRIYVTFRRAPENAPSDMLAVVDLCIILENKGETPPHSYCQIHKNLNKGLVGSDVFLCYKKAMTKTDILAYKPAILDRYPKEDYEDFPLPEQVPMFCLPMGATVECWSAKAQHPFPVFSTFILTGIGWQKVYGAAITFYEEFPEEKLTDLQMRHLGLKNKHIREQYRIMKTVHANKSICLLSHWPFFDAFRKLLTYMYRISITGPHVVPIERHISHFMYDVPYPSSQRPRILVQLSHDSLSLSMPEDSPLPQSGASHITMLKNLGPENCMTILLYVLHEYKIVIHSLRPAVLTSVAEAVSTLIFPLQWQCPYIPLCPLGLSDYLNAPTPYIIGLDSRYFDLFDPPSDVICIDLDTIRIWPSDDKKHISYKLLPKKPLKVLQETLHRLYARLSEELPRHTQDEVTLDMAPIDLDFKKKHKEMLLELQIQEAFLRFMASILKGYKNFLKPIENRPDLDTTKASALFDMNGFMKSRDKANHKFFSGLLNTQIFIRFIEERSFVSDKDASLAFFDECTEKVNEITDEPKLIEVDDSSKSERTMFILPPEPTGLPEGEKYSYNGFPALNPDLFLERKVAVTPSLSKKSQDGRGSPVARRTKQEVRTAQKSAQQILGQPVAWAKCLLTHCYSLWFMMLPAYIKESQSVNKALKVAYDVLKEMQGRKLKPPDELCYRVMLQLCGRYNQPVLAVKVYSEMKHAGVQPNAITYGYYNKAVLEGKWPSSISRGRKLWRKLRNVIIGVAQFRKALRRRRSLSLYSNTESAGSEYDQISHASIDSFLEDAAGVGSTGDGGKHEPIMKVEAGVEISQQNGGGTAGAGGVRHGNIPEELERAASDRGYNSMTQEDAKTFSDLISEEQKESESRLKKEVKNALGSFGFRKKHKKKESEIKEEKATDGESDVHVDGESEEEADEDGVFQGSDSTTAEQFRSRVGSIVRKCSSVSGSGAHDKPRGSLFGSSAGLLMVSQSLDQTSLSQSMGHPVGRSRTAAESQRKRHKSAGDHTHATKTRSNSLFASWKNKHINDKDSADTKLDELIAKDDAEAMMDGSGVGGVGVAGTTVIGEMQDIVEEIKDSGVALDDNEVGDGENEEVGNGCSCDDDGEIVIGDDAAAHEQVKNGLTESGLTDSGLVDTNKDVTRESESEQKKLGATIEQQSSFSKCSNEHFEIDDCCSRADRSRSGSLKSNTSSPSHSVATPVTENDPLGLFVEPPRSTSRRSLSPSPQSSPQKNRDKFVATKPFQGELKFVNKNSDSTSQTTGQCNTSINSQTSATESTTGEAEESSNSNNRVDNSHQSAVGRVMSPVVEKVQNTLFQRTNSFPENLGANMKDGMKTPVKQNSQSSDHRETVSLGRSNSSLNEANVAGTPRSGLFNRTGSFRRHKENFSGMLKYATGAVANKLTEIKLSMTPSKLGSNTSIGQADDMDSDDEDSLSGSGRRKGSHQYHHASHDRLDSSSINGTAPIPESAPSHPSFMDQVDAMFESEKSALRVQFAATLDQDAADVVVAMEAEVCSNSRCPRCRCLLYDEEIMAGWSADDSNLNTSCPFCSTKLVPHLLIYLKDNRGRKKKLDAEFDGEEEDNGDIYEHNDSHISSSSYGKDSNICSVDGSQFIFGDMDDNSSVKSLETSQDPWMRQSAQEVLPPEEVPASTRPQSEAMSISEMASAGRHRRTGSECMTSATENMYSSSIESVESFTFRNLRSPLSMSIDGEVVLPTVPSLSPETKRAPFERGSSPLDPVSVPYLSPLVLRKNLETIVESEGNGTLARDTFVDEHPIIYWNLVWYLKRINTPSHLPGFLLTTRSYNKDPEAYASEGYTSENVLIRPMWDNIRTHEEVGLPMHLAWNKCISSTTVDALITEAQPFNRAVMNEIITSIQCNHVLGPIKMVMNCRRRFRPRRKRFRSMYREILYLSFVACGRENIDPDAFDREYKLAFTKLSGGEIKRLQRDDKPRSPLIQCCRRVFSELEL